MRGYPPTQASEVSAYLTARIPRYLANVRYYAIGNSRQIPLIQVNHTSTDLRSFGSDDR